MSLRIILPSHIASDPQKRAASLRPPRTKARALSDVAAAGQFDFPATLVGSTPDGNVSVYYDPSLGTPGADLAQQLLDQAASTYSACEAFFGVPGESVNVILAALNGVTDGSGGAYHYGCNFASGGNLYCDVAFGNVDLVNGLFVAELTESFMGAQNAGWDCGASTGEALSRFLAEALSGGPGGALAEYASAPAWDAQGRPNWIEATDPTDQDLVSTGCGVLYLYWMTTQGFTSAQITQAGCPDGTLASNYSMLTGATTGWADFSAAVAGLTGPIASDDPWAVTQMAAESSAVVNQQLEHPGP